jgi:hypothetical protein
VNIAVKTAEISASREARKSQKQFQDTPISGCFGSNPAVLIPQRRETARPIPI